MIKVIHETHSAHEIRSLHFYYHISTVLDVIRLAFVINLLYTTKCRITNLRVFLTNTNSLASYTGKVKSLK